MFVRWTFNIVPLRNCITFIFALSLMHFFSNMAFMRNPCTYCAFFVYFINFITSADRDVVVVILISR